MSQQDYFIEFARELGNLNWREVTEAEAIIAEAERKAEEEAMTK